MRVPSFTTLSPLLRSSHRQDCSTVERGRAASLASSPIENVLNYGTWAGSFSRILSYQERAQLWNVSGHLLSSLLPLARESRKATTDGETNTAPCVPRCDPHSLRPVDPHTPFPHLFYGSQKAF
jgi:hypothetical protein